ncbi:MAG: hypothetical protein K2K56_06915 [Lachnospiraceae bacterium]|nr:hypothetical protein [Lachnospiraceae bacterium]
MLWIILLIFMLMFPLGRFLLTNTYKIILGLFPDLFQYIRYKRWNECPSYGRIVCYTGLFGQGKTKECVRFITRQYERYNGKMIYDFEHEKWVQQKINVFSNVDLAIPYINLESLQQLVDCQFTEFGNVNLFLIDEASVVFNSRDFKKNFSTPALNTILTSRHHKIGIYLTAQRFGHMDALLRQVTSSVYECSFFKPLRIQKIKVYDAWECENCSNLLLLKPLRVIYRYTTNEDYEAYNTNAMVSAISKKCTDGDFCSDEEVLERQGNSDSDIKMLNRAKGKLKKRM